MAGISKIQIFMKNNEPEQRGQLVDRAHGLEGDVVLPPDEYGNNNFKTTTKTITSKQKQALPSLVVEQRALAAVARASILLETALKRSNLGILKRASKKHQEIPSFYASLSSQFVQLFRN